MYMERGISKLRAKTYYHALFFYHFIALFEKLQLLFRYMFRYFIVGYTKRTCNILTAEINSKLFSKNFLLREQKHKILFFLFLFNQRLGSNRRKVKKWIPTSLDHHQYYYITTTTTIIFASLLIHSSFLRDSLHQISLICLPDNVN